LLRHDAGVSPPDPHGLQRFVDAQDGVFEAAIAELRSGSKQSHWMWFVFPQLRGLGRSPNAQFFGISGLDEARAYLSHPLLGDRLRDSVEAVLPWAGERTAEQILGPVDAMKLRSSLTLFDAVGPHSLFGRALSSFFGGLPDERTLALIAASR
jgi:uncharacterized protein (DUF1810 family)